MQVSQTLLHCFVIPATVLITICPATTRHTGHNGPSSHHLSDRQQLSRQSSALTVASSISALVQQLLSLILSIEMMVHYLVPPLRSTSKSSDPFCGSGHCSTPLCAKLDYRYFCNQRIPVLFMETLRAPLRADW